MRFWISKLGNKYVRAEVEDNEQLFKSQLIELRRLPHNRYCADCGQQPTVWASVNIGCFLCLRCGSIHRGIGTHISIPKGCTGTYLWGPDEIERMKSRGNEYCEQMYGGNLERPSPDASDETWRTYIVNKYEYKKYTKKSPGETRQQQQVNVLYRNMMTHNVVTKTRGGNVTGGGVTIVEMKEKNENNAATTDLSQKHNLKRDFFAQFGL